MALVSVIVPTYNRATLLDRALASVNRQSFPDWEVIVADDGSTDSTSDVLQCWQERMGPERFKIVASGENQGVSAARNRAAWLASGQWLAFLDSDDEWLPEKLEKQLCLAGDFEWIHGEEIWIRNGVRVNAMKKHRKAGGRIFSRCVEICCVSPSAALVKKGLFMEMGGFREDFSVCEDYELWLRLASRYEAGFVREPVLVKYGGHEDQLSRRFKAMDYFRCRALLPFLHNADLSPAEHRQAAASIADRCAILLDGYAKHGQFDHILEVREWQARAWLALSEIEPQERSHISIGASHQPSL